jgi:hypothetical protein
VGFSAVLDFSTVVGFSSLVEFDVVFVRLSGFEDLDDLASLLSFVDDIFDVILFIQTMGIDFRFYNA